MHIIKESNVHQQVVNYLRVAYPKVLFRTDFAAGIKMTLGQAVKHKSLQKCRAWPDIFIAHAKDNYAGLFLELKRSRDEVYTKAGKIKSNKHIIEQCDVLCELMDNGYRATFACGFEDAKRIIDQYLS